MEIVTLSQNEQAAYGGATHLVRVLSTDLTAAATTQTLPILPASGTLPAGTIVQCIGHRVVTAFAGPSISALTLQVGDGGDTDRLATAALDDLTAVGWTAVPASVTTQPFAFASADAIDALFTATGANLSVLTAGEVQILLRATPFLSY